MEFINDNIVGTVIILSLIVWIPASCIVNYVDNKRRKQEEEEMAWKKPDVSVTGRCGRAFISCNCNSHLPLQHKVSTQGIIESTDHLNDTNIWSVCKPAYKRNFATAADNKQDAMKEVATVLTHSNATLIANDEQFCSCLCHEMSEVGCDWCSIAYNNDANMLFKY